MSELKLKVCGMKDADNITELVQLSPNFIGFIFYKNSPRYVTNLDSELTNNIPHHIKKVGVFVNENLETILDLHERYKLDYVQLHGDEGLDLVKSLKQNGVKVIKVFRLTDSLPDTISDYSDVSDYFLFETESPSYGGSGRHFDWSILNTYNLSTPFFLSGGIGLDDIDQIKKLEFEQMLGIDVNSKFEVAPGMKNIELIKELTDMI